ncbi:MAG: hypothetical protein WC290_02910 [archaeon]
MNGVDNKPYMPEFWKSIINPNKQKNTAGVEARIKIINNVCSFI